MSDTIGQESADTQRLKELRTAHRVRLTCPANYQIWEGGKVAGSVNIASTVDISTKGVLLRATQYVEIGTRLRIQIQVPWPKPELLAIGRVVRIEEEELAQRYLLGIHFEEIEPASQVDFLRRMETFDLQRLLHSLVQTKGTDMHLTTGHPPIIRVHDRLTTLNWPPFKAGEIRAIIYGIMSREQIENFEQQREQDFAYSLSLQERFRFNLHWQRGHVEAAVRVIPSRVPPWEELGIPPVVVEWTRAPSGLILVAGPIGSGKTTTLNSLVHAINQEREVVIICLERPIEYVHQNVKAVIKQREIGSDTLSYAEALRRSLRQDPDVIVVGEIENAETVEVVLNAAESGNLVMASFHATNTVQAIDRLLSMGPPQLRNQLSVQLANCLRGIVTQYLVPKEETMGEGLVLATEVFVPTDAGRNYIRTNSLSQISTVIETGATYQMHTLERSLRKLCTQGLVSEDVVKNILTLYGYSAK